MARRAVITGMGAVTGFGPGVERLFSALVEGRRAVRRRSSLAEAGLPSMVALADPADALEGPDDLDEESAPALRLLTGPDRAVGLSLQAAREAITDASRASPLPRGASVGVSLGTTLGALSAFLAPLRRGSPPPFDAGSVWREPALAVAREAGARGPLRVESVACASGTAAIGAALDDVRAGRAEVVLAGGVDVLTDFVLAGFGSLKAADVAPCRPFDATRAGLNLGEAAAFLVVESEEHARARGARIRAVLAGRGDAADAHHMTGPDPSGRGAARAMRAALDDAGLDPDAVDTVNAHGTSTLFNDLMEHHALHLAFGPRAARLPVNSIKGAVGHTLGAAGALEALLCVRQLEAGLLVPTAGHGERDPQIDLDVVAGAARNLAHRVALSTSSGFGGVNASVVLVAAD